MRLLILLTMLGMALLAGVYLRSRYLSRWEYVGWAMLLVLIPLLGPFLVILSGPGQPRRLQV
jgi:hypothetical protein